MNEGREIRPMGKWELKGCWYVFKYLFVNFKTHNFLRGTRVTCCVQGGVVWRTPPKFSILSQIQSNRSPPVLELLVRSNSQKISTFYEKFKNPHLVNI